MNKNHDHKMLIEKCEKEEEEEEEEERRRRR